MQYNVQLEAIACKQLARLDRVIRVRIARAIDDLANDPFPDGVVRLQGVANTYRIRVGDYRVLYKVDNGELVVLVIRIAHRRESYR